MTDERYFIGHGPEISVVAPLHNKESSLEPLFRAICRVLEPLGRSFEVVFVNDGSTDSTEVILDELACTDSRLRPVHLDRNYGKAGALCAGFDMALGDIVLTLDPREDNPQELLRLLGVLEIGGYSAVSGWRRSREGGSLLRALSSKIANWLIGMITGLPSKDNGCGLKAYRAHVVRGIYLPQSLHRFMPAIFGVRADEFGQIEIADGPPRAGQKRYGIRRVFEVIRDMLAFPFLVRDAETSLQWMNLTIGLAGGVCFAAIVFLLGGMITVAAILGIIGVLGLTCAASIRKSIFRWMAIQRKKNFRLKLTPQMVPTLPYEPDYRYGL